MSKDSTKTHISIVIPVYKAEKHLQELHRCLIETLSPITTAYEIILVEDYGGDSSVEIIKRLAGEDPRIKPIFLSRNFGQHSAIAAGLDHSKGQWVIVMDCDLQDRPEEIKHLYEKAQQGYDIVLARRSVRNDPILKRFGSYVFYRTLGYLTDTEQDHTIANFGIYHRQVIDAICDMKDYCRYFPTMVKWVGFKSTNINVKHSERMDDKSSYNLRKLLALAANVIIVFSDKPLRLTVKLGLFISGTAFLFVILNLFRYIRGEIVVAGWTTLIVSIWFLSGLIIFILGMLGLYIGKSFDQVKRRPTYIERKDYV